MERLKEFFAFPLFATVLWLLWILGQQTQTQGWLLAVSGLLTVSFSIWLAKNSPKLKILIWILTLAALAGLARQLNFLNYSSTQSQTSAWSAYDESKLAEARTKGQPVFVDFTAAWCITCQLNKQTVLDTTGAQEIFKKEGILLMRADWTRYDPVITQALSKLGRSSVPVYAFYGKGAAVKLLPQILTLSMIEDLKPKEK